LMPIARWLTWWQLFRCRVSDRTLTPSRADPSRL
jgi:hypothetical protein